MGHISLTVEQVDETFLQEAAKVLGTERPEDTVNAALREVVRARLAALYVDSVKRRASDDPDAERDDAWR